MLITSHNSKGGDTSSRHFSAAPIEFPYLKMNIITLLVWLGAFRRIGAALGSLNYPKRSSMGLRGDTSHPRPLSLRSRPDRKTQAASKFPILNKEIRAPVLNATDSGPPTRSSFRADNPRVSIQSNGCVQSLACVSPDPDKFQFCLDFENMGSRATEFAVAAGRFERLILNDLAPVPGDIFTLAPNSPFDCPCGLPTLINDMYVCVKSIDIDGPGGVLGRASTRFRRSDGSAILGYVQVDSSDLNRLSKRSFSDFVAHEIGHVLGLIFRDLFNDQLEYIGEEGLRVWREEWGCEGTPPLGFGGGHWDERCFRTELMTPFLQEGSEISSMTIAALKDRGYPINETIAREFEGKRDFLNQNCCTPGNRNLRNGAQAHRHLEAYQVSRQYSDLDPSELPPVSAQLFEKMRLSAEEYLIPAKEMATEIKDYDGVVWTDSRVEVYAIDDFGQIIGLGFE